MSDDLITERVEAGKLAKECLELVADQLTSDVMRVAFVEKLRLILIPLTPEQSTSLAPIGRLGAVQITFGQHAGKCYDDVPLDYLDWLCGQQENNLASLRAYLKHPEIESRRGSREWSEQ